ncbi:MAG: DUF3137 domain-containing protein [Deferribacteraceae bacterium]|jgi:hypothetical protein|nr:DUF3137 domain-containing protein [Deferribacteraceae bacterium]
MSVTKLVKQMRNMLAQAKTHDDLQAIMQLAISYGRPICYNNVPLYLTFIAIAIATGLTWWRYGYHIIWLIAFSVLALIPLIVAIFRSSRLQDLEQELFLRDAIYDNGMQPVDPPSMAELDRRYGEFVRGNYTREIEYYVQGYSEKEEHNLSYSVYKFHYVVRTKQKKGYSYSHYYRYGVILDNFTTDSLLIMSSSVPAFYPTKWTTESIDFNKRFKVYAKDELSAAKFLKPAVILKIEEFAKRFPKANIEIDADARLCVSFDTIDLLDLKLPHRLADAKAFSDSTKGHTIFSSLQEVLDFLYLLMVQTDSNFK